MRKSATFIAAVATMAVLGSLIYFLEKAKTGEEWAFMTAWFRLCDWLLPKPQSASSHQGEDASSTSPRAGDLSDVRNQELRVRGGLAIQR